LPTDQVELITLALIYKFMDDLEDESVKLGGKRSFFTGGLAKYRWRAGEVSLAGVDAADDFCGRANESVRRRGRNAGRQSQAGR